MSNIVFPGLPGLTFNAIKAPGFNTRAQRSVSGFEARAAFQAYPLWTYTLAYEVLRHGSFNDLRQMLGFFLARQGSFDSFLFTDPEDNAVVDQSFGSGDGGTRVFTLQRTLGYGAGSTFSEPVHNVNIITNIKVNGTPTVAYTIDGSGTVTFTSAPAALATITWSGSYYYRVRFLQDMAEFNKFLQDLFELKKLQFIGSPMNKV
jgi:uncharacterized protein (TIGR02217 family)